MTLKWCSVHKRILFGLVAWLLGATSATAGSLLAVSLLGQGIGGGAAQQLTQEAVNRALASEGAESSPVAAPTPTRTVLPVAKPARPSPTATPDHSQATATTPSPAATQNDENTSGTVFTSKGGEVLASCQAAGAYLLSWTPLQGFHVDDVLRGPAAAARVTFESTAVDMTMMVTCSAGVPSARTSTDH